MKPTQTDQSETYRVLVRETLDIDFRDWYGDLAILPQKNGETALVGRFSDQSALRGFLEQLWNLNITVITVERIENES